MYRIEHSTTAATVVIERPHDIGYRSHETCAMHHTVARVQLKWHMHGISNPRMHRHILSAHFSPPRPERFSFPNVESLGTEEDKKKRDLIEFYTFQELELVKL